MTRLERVLKKVQSEDGGTTMASFPQFQHVPVGKIVKKKKQKGSDENK